MFSDATEGLGVKLSAFLENTVGDEGSVSTRQTTLAKQIADIDKQVIDMERIIQANRQRLIDSFVAMEILTGPFDDAPIIDVTARNRGEGCGDEERQLHGATGAS